MTDVLAEWKKNKFITVGRDLLDNIDEILIILTDIGFWAEHEEELKTWCELYGASAMGMTVTLPDQKTLTAFTLKWS